MINQNYALDLSKIFPVSAPQVSASQTTDLKAAKSDDRKSVSSFKEMLGSAEKVRDNTSNEKPAGLRKDNNDIKDDTFKTFRSASTNKVVRSEQSVSDDSKEIRNYSDAKEKLTASRDEKTDDTQSNEVIQSLAGVLGVDASKLEKIFESLGINAQDLADSTKSGEALEKLSSVLGLDNDQKEALTQITQLISKQLEALKSSESAEKSLTQNKESKPAEVQKQATATITETKVETSDIKQLINELKGVIQEFSAKLKDDPKKFYDDLSQSVKAVMEKLSASVSTDTVSTVSEGSTENQPQNGTKQDSNEEISKAQNANQAETKVKDAKADTVKETSVKETVGTADNNKDTVNNQPAATINQPQADLKSNNVSKADKTLPVSKNEIVNQVIEKAKVLTNGEKSEMIIDLKPDSLGKLSLKVITERGIVTAQFVAESQQVKQVLESNMQLLKDSLEKQGLAVQNFSVSVGQQNSERNFGRNEGYSQENKSTGNKVSGLGQGRITTVEEVSSSTQRINPYDWTNSKINLTA